MRDVDRAEDSLANAAITEPLISIAATQEMCVDLSMSSPSCPPETKGGEIEREVLSPGPPDRSLIYSVKLCRQFILSVSVSPFNQDFRGQRGCWDALG